MLRFLCRSRLAVRSPRAPGLINAAFIGQSLVARELVASTSLLLPLFLPLFAACLPLYTALGMAVMIENTATSPKQRSG